MIDRRYIRPFAAVIALAFVVAGIVWSAPLALVGAGLAGMGLLVEGVRYG